jgi:hypothetical protein
MATANMYQPKSSNEAIQIAIGLGTTPLQATVNSPLKIGDYSIIVTGVDPNSLPKFGEGLDARAVQSYSKNPTKGYLVEYKNPDVGTIYEKYNTSGNLINGAVSKQVGGNTTIVQFDNNGLVTSTESHSTSGASNFVDLRDALETAAVIAGNYVLPGSSLVSSQLVSQGAKENLSTDLGQTANLAAGVSGGMAGNNANWTGGATDPNAVGGVTGPDNIDVGGGWSPATGATAAELEAARLALQAPPELSGYDAAMADLANAQPAFDGSQVTADQITSNIAGDNIDAGGGWSPATGATEAELAQARAAMASTGWTMGQALDAVRAGLLVNAITGDPLGLGGGQPEQAAPKGFDIVPVPTDWKSPTYASTPVQNVSFEDLFPGVSLQGTQWAGLQNAQPNMSFNDIFASGLQSTPMGMPVNINDIVGNIIGQSAKS